MEQNTINDVQPLTDAEVQTLQVDAAVRKVGALDEVLVKLNIELAEKLNAHGLAKVALDIAKSKKSIIVERLKNLKVFIKGAQDEL